MIANSCSRSICNPYFDDFWVAMTRIMSKSLALLQWVKDCPSDYVGSTSGVPEVAADLSRRPSRQPRASKRHGSPLRYRGDYAWKSKARSFRCRSFLTLICRKVLRSCLNMKQTWSDLRAPRRDRTRDGGSAKLHSGSSGVWRLITKGEQTSMPNYCFVYLGCEHPCFRWRRRERQS
jgi:hypothetical protein